MHKCTHIWLLCIYTYFLASKYFSLETIRIYTVELKVLGVTQSELDLRCSESLGLHFTHFTSRLTLASWLPCDLLGQNRSSRVRNLPKTSQVEMLTLPIPSMHYQGPCHSPSSKRYPSPFPVFASSRLCTLTAAKTFIWLKSSPAKSSGKNTNLVKLLFCFSLHGPNTPLHQQVPPKDAILHKQTTTWNHEFDPRIIVRPQRPGVPQSSRGVA